MSDDLYDSLYPSGDEEVRYTILSINFVYVYMTRSEKRYIFTQKIEIELLKS